MAYDEKGVSLRKIINNIKNTYSAKPHLRNPFRYDNVSLDVTHILCYIWG